MKLKLKEFFTIKCVWHLVKKHKSYLSFRSESKIQCTQVYYNLHVHDLG